MDKRELKQANKQLNFSVKKEPKQRTTYAYCIFEAFFMIKSLWKNCIDCFEVDL